jgi:hypothetical protein
MKKQVSHSIFFYYICGKLIFMNMKESIETQIIEEKDIIYATPEQPKKECKSCKRKTLSKSHWLMVITSVYLLFASIYGTVKLIKELINLF